jgi:hypothetical protein
VANILQDMTPSRTTRLRRSREGRLTLSELGVSALLLSVYASSKGAANALGAARRLLP